MSRQQPGIPGLIARSLVFVLVTVSATVVLGATIRNGGGGGGERFTAMFSDATSLQKGDDVRMAGVRIGQVSSVEVSDQRLAKVTFSIDDGVRVRQGSTAVLRFRNLVGQRYLALVQNPDATRPPIAAGSTFDLEHTQPALDITALFNGFQPLFRLLSPKDVNDLSYQIISVFQGEGSTVTDLLARTSRLTSTLADKDQVIGSVIDNLDEVLKVVSSRSGELSSLITTLQSLVSGLAKDRDSIGSAVSGIGDLTTSVSDLLEEGRAPLKGSIRHLGEVSKNLADDGPTLSRFLTTLPTKLDRLGTLASYGSWLNAYLCEVTGDLPQPEGFLAGTGVDLTAARCGA